MKTARFGFQRPVGFMPAALPATRAAAVTSLVSTAVVFAGIFATGDLAAAEMRSESRAGQETTAAGRDAARDLLEAEREGLVTVRFIPNNSRSAQVVVTNRTKKPLTLRLPAAFVGVPVLAQFGGGGAMGNAGFGAGGMGAPPQTVGGGGALGAGAGGGGFGGGMGGAAFSVPPEKSRVVKVRTVCLEHGKAEPQPRYSYRLDHYESFSTDPALQGVLESLGRGEINSQVAQAAAWNLSSGRSWQQIADERIDHIVEQEPFFTDAEVLAAKQVVAAAVQAREASPEPRSSAGN